MTSETEPTNGDRFKWTGRELDSETGLQYNRARYYDPKTGRWISQDPIGFDAGDGNLYRYVRNDTPNFTDATGLDQGSPPPSLPPGFPQKEFDKMKELMKAKYGQEAQQEKDRLWKLLQEKRITRAEWSNAIDIINAELEETVSDAAKAEIRKMMDKMGWQVINEIRKQYDEMIAEKKKLEEERMKQWQKFMEQAKKFEEQDAKRKAKEEARRAREEAARLDLKNRCNGSA